MYDELVKALRYCNTGGDGCVDCPYADTTGCIGVIREKAAEAIKELQKAVNFHKFNSEFWEDKYNSLADEKWIPVTERLPDTDGDYLVWFYDARCWKVAEYSKHTAKERHVWWFAGIDRTKFVTHWMPLPEPPKEE